MRAIVTLIVVVSLAAFAARPARGDDADNADDPARAAFREGAALVDQSEWASALSAFERSLALREHALTLYNIGVCERFLGRLTLARETLRRSLARNETASGEMPALFVDQARAYLAEIEAKLAHLTIALSPPSTRVAIDGRPLAAVEGAPGVFVAGVAEPGEGKPVDAPRFEVLVDPRSTVLTFTLEGHSTIEIRKDPTPGSHEEIPISMTEQPAQIRIASNVKGAIVHVDGADVGLAPVIVSRPPGVRVVSVAMDGYVPYESKITLKPGQLVPLDAELAREKTPVTKKWWFWAGSVTALVAVGVITYFIVRPAPTRPDPNPGGLGWVADVH